ncbi:hypothetical protein GMI69_02295 [Eggerthellaceae bacterium zg-887]|uniref:N-acetylmuramoyl-L-alanine amidase family protein n=1 Tax=Xiamenia xianingshaonis TaxID=2682776 RepID=UPI00140B8B03|nr:N-acetylmuramoyl-L-alanine amidase family protein [Xiamenia xianingshaonis]NHM15503.1 hypothetical protein [Xiamenia xianingshaonis]
MTATAEVAAASSYTAQFETVQGANPTTDPNVFTATSKTAGEVPWSANADDIDAAVKRALDVYLEDSEDKLDEGSYKVSYTQDGSPVVDGDNELVPPSLPGEYGVVVTVNGEDDPIDTDLTVSVIADLGNDVDYKLGAYSGSSTVPINLVWDKSLTTAEQLEADVLEQFAGLKAFLKDGGEGKLGTPVDSADYALEVTNLAKTRTAQGSVTVTPASKDGYYAGSFSIKYAYGDSLPEFSLAKTSDVYSGEGDRGGYDLGELVNVPKVRNASGVLEDFNEAYYKISASYVNEKGETVPVPEDERLQEVRTYTITVEGQGTYAGSQSFDFTITPRPVTAKEVDWTGASGLTYDKDTESWYKAFNGAPLEPTPTLTIEFENETTANPLNKANANDAQLKAGIWDYEVTYENNKNVGTAMAVVTFNHNYSGTVELPFEIRPASLKTLEAVATAQNQLASAFPEKPTVEDVKGIKVTYVNDARQTVTLKEGDYTVKSIRKVGDTNKKGETTYEFVVEGQGDYTGEVTGTFKTVADSMDIATLWTATVDEGDYFYKNGAHVPADVTVMSKATANKPAAEVKEVVGSKRNYEVVCTNDVDAGTATATIVGCGDYAGSIELTYEIAPLQISQESVADVKLKQTSFDYVPGIEAKPEIEWNKSTIVPVNEGYTGGVVYLSWLINDVEITYADNDKAGTAQVVITGKEGGNVSGSYAVDFAIKPADLAKAEVAGPKAPVAPGTSLADALSVTYQGQAVDAADYTAASEDAVPGAASVTVTGTGNFTGTAEADVTVLYDVAGLDYQVSSGTYNGQSQTPTITASYKDAAGKTVEVPASALNIAAGSYVNAGKYSVKVSGNEAAGWGGQTTVEYTIAPATVTAKPQVSYDAAGLPVVTVPGLTSSDFDYKADAATKTITVTYKGNYKGTATVPYTPAAKPVAPEQPAAGKTGWVGSGNDWAYYEGGKQVKDQWKLIGGEWYHFEKSGKMTNTKWFQDTDGEWYLLNQSHKGSYGAMLTGWQKVDGGWYYMGSDGAMQSGWAKVNGEWYLLNTEHDGTFGKMLTGWQQVGGKWYYMDASGAMASNEWVGRYWVNGSGVWTATR